MKIIKRILLFLVLLVALAAIVGFLSPSHVHVERSLIINAPSEIVFEKINNLKKWNSWSPWYEKDSTMKIAFNGIDAGAGAGYKWTSNHKEVGNGEMTITASTPDSISTAMNFMENGVATGKFLFANENNGTKVTWVMECDMGMNPIGRIFGLFMDKMLGPDFEKGLGKLKQVSETTPSGLKAYRGYEVLEKEVPETTYIGKKDSMSWSKIEEFYSKSLPALFEAIGKANLEITGSPSSLYFEWDSVSKTTLMAVAIPVKGNSNTKVKGYETIVIPSGKNLHITHLGAYSSIATAHYAMDDYIKEKNLMQESPVIEEYVSGPEKEADSTRWITHIYYRLK